MESDSEKYAPLHIPVIWYENILKSTTECKYDKGNSNEDELRLEEILNKIKEENFDKEKVRQWWNWATEDGTLKFFFYYYEEEIMRMFFPTINEVEECVKNFIENDNVNDKIIPLMFLPAFVEGLRKKDESKSKKEDGEKEKGNNKESIMRLGINISPPQNIVVPKDNLIKKFIFLRKKQETGNMIKNILERLNRYLMAGNKNDKNKDKDRDKDINDLFAQIIVIDDNVIKDDNNDTDPSFSEKWFWMDKENDINFIVMRNDWNSYLEWKNKINKEEDDNSIKKDYRMKIFIIDLLGELYNPDQDNENVSDIPGLEIIRKIRKTEDNAFIITFTAANSPFVFSLARNYGADLVIPKSVERHGSKTEGDALFYLLWAIFSNVSIWRFLEMYKNKYNEKNDDYKIILSLFFPHLDNVSFFCKNYLKKWNEEIEIKRISNVLDIKAKKEG